MGKNNNASWCMLPYFRALRSTAVIKSYYFLWFCRVAHANITKTLLSYSWRSIGLAILDSSSVHWLNRSFAKIPPLTVTHVIVKTVARVCRLFHFTKSSKPLMWTKAMILLGWFGIDQKNELSFNVIPHQLLLCLTKSISFGPSYFFIIFILSNNVIILRKLKQNSQTMALA